MTGLARRTETLGWLSALAVAGLLSHALTRSLEIDWFPAFSIAGSPAGVFKFVLGVTLELVLWMMGLKRAVEALLDAAHDRPGANQSGGSNASDGQALRQLALLMIYAALLYLGFLSAGAALFALLLVATLLTLPAAIMLLAVDEYLGHALSPLAWRALVGRLGAGYVSAIACLGLLVAAGFAAQAWLFSRLPEWPAEFAWRLALLGALVFGYQWFGRLLFHQRDELGLDTRAPIARPTLANAEEDAIMRSTDALLANGESAQAIAVLARLIRGRGASAPIHQRYRHLLMDAKDGAGLSQHGRGYIATLLALGQDKPAMALLLESLARDADFQMESPEELSRLIAHAADNGQSQLAVRLAQQFARRFPRDRELVANGLVGARLLADRLGRSAEASAWLVQLLGDYPEHALARDLRACLEAIERVDGKP